MKSLLILQLALVVATEAWLFSSSDNGNPTWDQLRVTFLNFNNLPISKDDAVKEGWTMDKACSARNYFAGNRYILGDDTAVMLLFDSVGEVAGIQMGIKKSVVSTKTYPWVSEGDMYVITAYFTDPGTICSRGKSATQYVGDRLLIQMGPTYKGDNNTMRIPYKEEDLKNTNWVAGKCFPLMGQHYWYGISSNMSCSDFFPVFIMYNGNKLDGFGWNTEGNFISPRYEHPTSDKFTLFFEEKTLPQCLLTAGSLTTQHVYFDNPYLNMCYF